MRKFIGSVFCMLVILSGFSFGILAEENKTIILSGTSIVEATPIEKNDNALNFYANPVVNITSPQNGTNLSTPSVEVIGSLIDRGTDPNAASWNTISIPSTAFRQSL